MPLIIVVGFLLYVVSNAVNICPNQDRECNKEGECCSKFGFCGTGDAWCKETWDFDQNKCPECPVCPDTPTPEPTEPFNPACSCMCYGDPHCIMWNCNTNSWQGPHQVDAINVYYMTPCNGYTHDDMPFDLIGVNQRYDEYFTSVDYTILKLYGPEQQVCIKHKGNEGVSYNTDCGDDYDITITDAQQNTSITVGVFFEMLWYFKNGYSRLHVRNKMKECIDEDNYWDLTLIAMTATDKEESTQITVSDCYKKYTCGMCGDFYHSDLNFQQADGTVIELDTGAWGGTANDDTGLSYAVEIEGTGTLTTPIPQRRLLSDSVLAGEPCHGLRDEIELQCHTQMKPYATDCCWDRLTWCQNHITVACGWDSCACVMGQSTNETQARYENTMEKCVSRVLNASMSFTCGLDASNFHIPDMSKYGSSTLANQSDCDECYATGNIFIGIVIGLVIFAIIATAVYCLVLKPKLQQKVGTGTSEAMYNRM